MKKEVERIGRTTTESVHKHTGKNWDQWIMILEKAGAKNWDFRQMAEFLGQKYKLTAWWRHVVAMGFEIHIGKRVEGRNSKGEYSVTVSKSLPLNQKKLWSFFVSPEGQDLWLRPLDPMVVQPKAEFEAEGGVYGEVRTMKAPARLRLKWQESDQEKSSVVQVWFLARTKLKADIVFTHEKLSSARDRQRWRDHWKSVCENMSDVLKGSSK